jgi:uncharacterized membrane protein YfcA
MEIPYYGKCTDTERNSMNNTAILLLIGLAAGVISGMLGIGGGIIIIPMLVGFLGFTQQNAQGTSLALLLPPIGILAVINYYNKGFVDIKAAAIMCITFLVGSYFSSKLAVTLPADVLKKIFAVFLILYALKLLLGK